MSEYRTEAEAVAAITRDGELQELEPGRIYLIHGVNGHEVINTDEYLEHPRHKQASPVITDVDSFIAYLEKHGNENTELWGSPMKGTVEAVIDAHGGNNRPACWGLHTAKLRLTNTEDWRDWLNRDRQWMTQSVFAEFIEDHLSSFLAPTAADMLELAKTFTANKNVAFESGIRTHSGETTLIYRETHQTKAGNKGDITIPDRLELAIAPFEGGATYKVPARFRYRITDQTLAMSIALERPRDILREAFTAATKQIGEETGHEVWTSA